MNRDFCEMYEKALECDGWGDVRRLADPASSIRLARATRGEIASRRSRLLAADAPFPSLTPSSPPFVPSHYAQVDAAEHAYHRLNVALKREVESNEAGLSRWELQQIAKLTALLNLRVKELRTDRDMGIGPEACKELKGYFSTFLLDEKAEFPFDVAPEAVGDAPVSLQLERMTVSGGDRGARSRDASVPVNDDDRETAHTTLTTSEGGSLMPPVRLYHRGDKALIVKVLKIGLKDADAYIDPYVTLSVVNASGFLLEATQDTPVTNRREHRHVLFNTCVHVQTPLRELGRDAVVVIEFKHYKPKKKKVSTKCWGFFSVGELDPSKESQQMALEVYAKPTDLRCKKINLLSVKELYLHVELIVQTE